MSYHKNTIYETIIQCSYSSDYHNHITTNINNVNEKKYNNFRMQKLNVHGKYWIGLFLDIQTIYNNTQKFLIPIQILIPDNFPYVAPIASVCLPGTNTIINQENRDIDPKSCCIITNSIKNWDWSTSLNKIIEEIQNSFNKSFPILQVHPGQNPNLNRNSQGDWKKECTSPSISPNYNPNTNPNMQTFSNQNYNQSPNIIDCNRNLNNNKIEIKDNYIDEKLNSKKSSSCNNVNLNWDNQSNSSDSTNNSSNQNTCNNSSSNRLQNNINYKSVNRNQQLSPKNNPTKSPFTVKNQNTQPGNFSNNNQNNMIEQTNANIKGILINQIKEKVQNRIIQEVNYQTETEKYLETAKLHLDYRAQKLSFNLDKSDEVINMIQGELKKINEDVNDLKNENTHKSSKFINKNNCYDFVLKDKKFDLIVNNLCSQASIEDILIYIKKGFEKGAISFDETVKSIRFYSRALMKLKFIKDKMLNKFK